MNLSFSSLSIKKNFLASWQMQYKMLACIAASLKTPPSACWDLSLSLSLSLSFYWTYLHGSQPGNSTSSLLSSSSWRFPTSRRQSMVSARRQRCWHHLQFLSFFSWVHYSDIFNSLLLWNKWCCCSRLFQETFPCVICTAHIIFLSLFWNLWFSFG